jgi:hypothetical protein
MRLLKNNVWPAILAVLLCSCGGTKGMQRDGNQDNYVTIIGKATQESNTPLAVVLFEARNGELYMVQSSRLGDELRGLVGMSLQISGLILREIEGIPVITVKWYDMLPLPTGERPIVGYVRQGGYIITDKDEIWKLEGDFQDVLLSFVGSKVWVAGIVQKRLNTERGSWRVIDVTEYGVISPY